MGVHRNQVAGKGSVLFIADTGVTGKQLGAIGAALRRKREVLGQIVVVEGMGPHEIFLDVDLIVGQADEYQIESGNGNIVDKGHGVRQDNADNAFKIGQAKGVEPRNRVSVHILRDLQHLRQASPHRAVDFCIAFLRIDPVDNAVDHDLVMRRCKNRRDGGQQKGKGKNQAEQTFFHCVCSSHFCDVSIIPVDSKLVNAKCPHGKHLSFLGKTASMDYPQGRHS